MPDTNITMLQTVADGLEELKENMVFVGGSVAELYVDHPAASDIRPTLDVDCVIELSSRSDHAKLEEALRTKKFSNDTTTGAPICRWVYRDIKVDVMPTNPDVLGFTNKWYNDGVSNKITKILPNGQNIFVFPVEYYVAAKFEAHKDRGGNNLRQSHDFEDIIYIFDNCPDILVNIQNANSDVKEYLKQECRNLLKNNNLTEGIETALPYGSDEENTDIILELIKRILELK